MAAVLRLARGCASQRRSTVPCCLAGTAIAEGDCLLLADSAEKRRRFAAPPCIDRTSMQHVTTGVAQCGRDAYWRGIASLGLILDLGPADRLDPRVESLGKTFESVRRTAVVIWTHDGLAFETMAAASMRWGDGQAVYGIEDRCAGFTRLRACKLAMLARIPCSWPRGLWIETVRAEHDARRRRGEPRILNVDWPTRSWYMSLLRRAAARAGVLLTTAAGLAIGKIDLIQLVVWHRETM